MLNSASTSSAVVPKLLRAVHQHTVRHTRIWLGTIAGLLIFVFSPAEWPLLTRLLAAWNGGALLFLTLVYIWMIRLDADRIHVGSSPYTGAHDQWLCCRRRCDNDIRLRQRVRQWDSRYHIQAALSPNRSVAFNRFPAFTPNEDSSDVMCYTQGFELGVGLLTGPENRYRGSVLACEVTGGHRTGRGWRACGG